MTQMTRSEVRVDVQRPDHMGQHKETTEIIKKKSNTPLNILFSNAQSLQSKVDVLSAIVEDRCPDLIGIVETWMDESHCEKDVALQNYQIELKNRHKNPNRGGILLYVKRNINYEVICPPVHKNGCKCENLWIRIQGGQGNGQA